MNVEVVAIKEIGLSERAHFRCIQHAFVPYQPVMVYVDPERPLSQDNDYLPGGTFVVQHSGGGCTFRVVDVYSLKGHRISADNCRFSLELLEF